MLILKEIIPKNFYIKVNGAPDLLKGTLRSHSTSFRSPSYNKGYTVQPSARASPKFFFRYATEKLRISLTLYEIKNLLMKNYYVLIAIALVIVISGCDKNESYNGTCANVCSIIQPSDTALQISALELEGGMYYGGLDQKKKVLLIIGFIH